MTKLKSILCAALILSPFIGMCDEPFNGLLLNTDGDPVKNARVYVTSPERYARTDKNGKFGLTNVTATDTLKIITKKRRDPYLIPVDGSKGLKIYLADEGGFKKSTDDEMVATGYNWVKRRESTGASSGISGEELRRTGKHDLLSALQGKVAGLYISGRNVNIRGTKSINMSSTPLFVVDGLIVDSFDGVSIYDIDHVEVLKDAPLYGVNGANGAILVYTIGYSKR